MTEDYRRPKATDVGEKKPLTQRQLELISDFTRITRRYFVAMEEGKNASQLDTTDRDARMLDADDLRVELLGTVDIMRGERFSAGAVKKIIASLSKSSRREKRIVANEITTELSLKIDERYRKSFPQNSKKK